MKVATALKAIGAVESLWTAFEKRKVFLTDARLFIRRSRMRRKWSMLLWSAGEEPFYYRSLVTV